MLCVKIHVVDSLFSDHAVPTRGVFWQEIKGKTGNIREQSFIREHDSLFCHHLVLSSVFVSCYHRLKSFVQFSSLSLCVVWASELQKLVFHEDIKRACPKWYLYFRTRCLSCKLYASFNITWQPKGAFIWRAINAPLKSFEIMCVVSNLNDTVYNIYHCEQWGETYLLLFGDLLHFIFAMKWRRLGGLLYCTLLFSSLKIQDLFVSFLSCPHYRFCTTLLQAALLEVKTK